MTERGVPNDDSFLERLHLKAKFAGFESCGTLVVFGLALFVTFFGERFLNRCLFFCSPETHSFTSWTFLFIPGMLLAIVAWYAEKVYVKTATINNPRQTSTEYSSVKMGRDRRHVLHFKFLLVCGCWWFWAFLGTEYYTCARHGPRPDQGVDPRVFTRLQAESELFAWVLLSGLILVAVEFPWRLTAFMRKTAK